MKELSIEQKAKRYDEAIEIAKEINNEQHAQPFNIMTRVFPELKDEDERIRKAIGYAIGQSTHSDGTLINGVSSEEAIDWLEKQCDKTAWSEDDEEIVEALNDYTKNLDIFFSEIKIGDKDILSKEFREKVQHWLKSLKDRVQPKREILEKLEGWLDEYVSDLANVDTASLICSFTNYLDGIKERKETKD